MKKSAKREIAFAENPSDVRKSKAKRMPIGATKSEILLFIANNGEADSVDLKWYLKEESGIKNKKSLRIHLSDLASEGMVSKRSKGKGLSDIYYLTNSFSNLTAVFNYLKENKKEKEFLTTRFFKEYVGSEDFKAKFFVHFTKRILLSMIAYLQSDEGYKEQLKSFGKYESKQPENFLTAIKNSKKIKPKYTKLEDWEKALALYDEKNVETLSAMVSSFASIIENTDVDTLYLASSSFGDWAIPFIKKATSLIIPNKEMPEFLAMLRTSPSATDFILNLDNASASGLMGILMRFIMWTVNDDPQKLQEFGMLANNKDNFSSNLPKMYGMLKDFSKVENKSPLLTLVSSMFIFDYIKRNVAINEEDQILLSNMLNSMLLPKIKRVTL